MSRVSRCGTQLVAFVPDTQQRGGEWRRIPQQHMKRTTRRLFVCYIPSIQYFSLLRTAAIMSVSSVDVGFSLSPKNLVVLGVVSTLVLVGLVLYSTFGTFSPITAKHIYNKHQKLNGEYKSLFRKRDNLAYHITWAKVCVISFQWRLLSVSDSYCMCSRQSRGEIDESTKQMVTDLEKLDEVRRLQPVCSQAHVH